ncbi:Recombinase [Gimesia alba]|uniref:Recombinase n=1 Tax=Gimesia alba TaxID=2527973 RepID=A0A517RJG9_9PLAN|nr:recombinase family protein [Gimesia alba]QDT44030.1 Recombinase [Gimesia alba]
MGCTIKQWLETFFTRGFEPWFIECGERGKLTPGFPQVIFRSVFLLLVLSVVTLAISVFFTVGNGYHRLLGKQSNTFLSQFTGLEAVSDERYVVPIPSLAGFGFYFVCVPLQKHLRILFYGRFSKDEQRQQSIEDQLQYCKEFLSEMGVDVSSLDEQCDRGISGEIHSRPGIDQVRQGIWKRNWDLIISEDSSRLFRGISPCMDLVGAAVDNDIRVICINDRVDTANDDWQQRLEEAQRHHGQDNYYTRFRIKRALNGLWDMGAAIGPIRAGYERYQKNPEQHKAPKFDRVDPDWAGMIRDAFQMVADGRPLDLIANYLTEQGLPKGSNAQKEEWTEGNVRSMVRCSLYRGEEIFRKTISRKQHTTGRSKQIRNPDPGNIQTRAMPHLRIIEDWLWYKANEVIDQRGARSSYPQGIDHPLYGISRDSRSPLSRLFICGICGSKMHMDGRREGGFRCSAASKNRCWNSATALRDFVYR